MHSKTLMLMVLVACTPIDKGSEIDIPMPEDSGMTTDTANQDVDLDTDGYLSDNDCDDRNAQINPGQSETPYDGIDNDCDAETPDDDLDGDGFIFADDCDDNESLAFPGAEEIVYDGIDNDCDPNSLDDDLDQDGHLHNVDCNDDDEWIFPGAEDAICDGIDNDCNGETDQDWNGDFLEPNNTIPSDLGELAEDNTIPFEAYLSPENDIDRFMVYMTDGLGPDFGLKIELKNVPSAIDLILQVDYIDNDGETHVGIAYADENGLGENETLNVDGGFFSNATGHYIIQVSSFSGESCAEPYSVVLTETGLL